MKRPMVTVSLRLLALMLALTVCAPAMAAEVFAQVRGVLLDAEGLPAEGYQVGLKNANGDLFLSAPTAADGHFELNQLPPDIYQMVSFDPQGVEFPLLSREVTLQGGQIERVEIRIAAEGAPPGRTGRGPASGKTGGLRGWWKQFPLAGKIGVVAVGAFAVYQIVDDESSTPSSVSPSSP